MSRDGFEALVAALDHDEELKARFAEAASPDDVARIATEAGFDVTVDDLTVAATTVTEDDLGAVGGGLLTYTEPSAGCGGPAITAVWCTM